MPLDGYHEDKKALTELWEGLRFDVSCPGKKCAEVRNQSNNYSVEYTYAT